MDSITVRGKDRQINHDVEFCHSTFNVYKIKRKLENRDKTLSLLYLIYRTKKIMKLLISIFIFEKKLEDKENKLQDIYTTSYYN